MWGCLISVILALLIVVVTLSLFSPGWDGVAFVRGMIVMPFVIGVWVVPISVVLGSLYEIIRRAVRVERGSGSDPYQ